MPSFDAEYLWREQERLRQLFGPASSQGAAPSFLVPGSTPRWAGSSAPVIGMAVEETGSGLLVPDRQGGAPFPMDGLRPYVTAAQVLDTPPTWEQLIGELTQIPITAFVRGCAWLMVSIQQDPGKARALELARTFLEGTARARAEALIKDEWVFLAPQAILAALKLR